MSIQIINEKTFDHLNESILVLKLHFLCTINQNIQSFSTISDEVGTFYALLLCTINFLLRPFTNVHGKLIEILSAPLLGK